MIKNQNLLMLPGYPEDMEAGVGWRWGEQRQWLVWRRWYHGRKDTIMERYGAKDTMRL